MARSENQGIQVTLIIFVITTVLFGIMSFLFFRQYDSATMELESARAKATTDSNAARSAQEDLNELKSQILGFPEATNMQQIRDDYALDMDTFGASLPEVQKTYRDVLASLHNVTLRAAYDLANTATVANERLKTENQERETTRQAQIKKYSEAAAAAEASQKQQQTAFQATVAQFEQTNSGLQKRLDELRGEFDQLNAAKTKEIADLNGVIQKLRNTLSGKIKEVEEIRTETFEVADGLVQLVDLRTGTVYLNLGRADNLRRSVTFSVHDQESNTLQGDGLKGRIEVTHVVGEHLARAKILEDEVANPILRGDFVYSPLWHPGRKVHFAFAGVMDLDGDGKSDRQAIQDLVKIASGVIDAEVTDTGERIGQLTLETRYLVLGDQPKEAPGEGAAFDGYSQIQTEAGQLGTKIISFQKFLDSVGWKDSQRMIQFGKVGDPADFLRPVPDGGRRNSKGSTSGQFRRRDPRERLQRPDKDAAAPPPARNPGADPAPM